MNLLNYLIPFALALGLLILVHEMGHYLVARWCGVKVLRFSIGFGKPLYVRRAGRDGTEWAIAAFPLGGYVKMLDEREAPVAPAELHRSFNRQSVYRRFAIVAAGPLANFLLAIVLYWGLFVAGTEELRPRIALSDTPAIAVAAGVREGDLVVAVDEEPVLSWQDLRWVLLRHALDRREVLLQVRTLEDVETFRRFDLSGIAIDGEDQDLIARIGLKPWRPLIRPVLGRLSEDGAAARAGLLPGDEVLAIGGEPIAAWGELVLKVRQAPGVPLRFEIRRAGEEAEYLVTPDAASENGERIGRIGVAVAEPAPGGLSMFATVRYGPFDAAAKAVRQTWETSVLSLQMIGRMITGEVSWKNLSGPVTIADYAGQSAQLGLSHYLKFVALISISLGVLNLLPIPVLDGGHLLYYTVEIIKGGPIPERVMEIGQQIGLVLLVMLMAFAFYNDINRLISG
ncbi:RIP metalloprotease RseP [Thauera aromatica]|uniref:Zinc metalloprotease n=1 Tax=Thauera aromatica K172 TaxID=44139 RepID=A0A2R4BP45_THAAR|nr:RIP metalloprotease RseP [Thauera aromatica]AVR88963.1 Membrane-associated zinc metalloprotease [Thauera aromatica K172]